MAGTLRDDLASLRINRRNDYKDERPVPRGNKPDRGGRGFVFGLIALLIWLIPISLVGFAGVYAYRKYEEVRAKPEVTLGVVEAMTTGEAEKLFSAKGYLKSRYQAMIGAKIPGRVEKMFVEEGTKVKKGQVLAVLEHKELDASLAARRATLKRTEAELAEARVELKQRKREADRAKRLSGQRVLSVEESEKLDANLAMSDARVEGLEAAIQLQNANVNELEENIRNMSLYAPFDGTVVEKQGEEGEIITPSAMSNSISRSAVVTLASLEKMEVETDVFEKLLSQIDIGQPAEVFVLAVPTKHYRGRLRQIIPMGDPAQGTVKVKVEILDPDASLFPKLEARVHFLPNKKFEESKADQLFVPVAAVFDEGGHSYAWVVDTESRIHKQAVEVATTNGALARVESGLSKGDEVVLSPEKSLRENEAVKRAR